MRDWRHRYTWYNPDATVNGGSAGYQDAHEVNAEVVAGSTCGGTLTQCNTQAFAAKVNETGLCGHRDWRVPDVDQLLSLPDYGRSQPAIDTAYFPNTPYSADDYYGIYWSSTIVGIDIYAGFVYFRDGRANSAHKGIDRYVRLVRARQ